MKAKIKALNTLVTEDSPGLAFGEVGATQAVIMESTQTLFYRTARSATGDNNVVYPLHTLHEEEQYKIR